MPHTLIIQNPRAQPIELQRPNPTIVRHAQLPKHAAALPDQDGGIQVLGRRRDEDLLGPLRQGLAQLQLQVRAEAGRLGRAADDHDAAEQVAAAAVVGARGVLDGRQDGAVQGHDGCGAVEGGGVDLGGEGVVGRGAWGRGRVVGRLGRADVFGRGRAGDGGARGGVAVFAVSGEVGGEAEGAGFGGSWGGQRGAAGRGGVGGRGDDGGGDVLARVVDDCELSLGEGVVGPAVVEVDAAWDELAAVDELVGVVEDFWSEVALGGMLARV